MLVIFIRSLELFSFRTKRWIQRRTKLVLLGVLWVPSRCRLFSAPDCHLTSTPCSPQLFACPLALGNNIVKWNVPSYWNIFKISWHVYSIVLTWMVHSKCIEENQILGRAQCGSPGVSGYLHICISCESDHFDLALVTAKLMYKAPILCAVCLCLVFKTPSKKISASASPKGFFSIFAFPEIRAIMLLGC